jgi:hypothetical protein
MDEIGVWADHPPLPLTGCFASAGVATNATTTTAAARTRAARMKRPEADI